jgi:hypothetical protein
VIPESDRYVLIKTLPDGTPTAVQPVPNLSEGQARLKTLQESEGDAWQLVDRQENLKPP